MANDGEVRIKITGDTSSVQSSVINLGNIINQNVNRALQGVNTQASATESALGGVGRSANGALAPLVNDAPRASSALDGISGTLDDISASATETNEHLEELINKLGETGRESESTGNQIGSLVQKLAGFAIAKKALNAVVNLGKEAVTAFAEYEQLVGGVETPFGTASEKVRENAENAYKFAGISANEYMNNVTSFSASLISSLSGDTQKAADLADVAMRDMSDNANKMGTDMVSIQNAYQGFAKQNFTLLDNLKLGFGGTKEEMERLLETAGKMTGKQYDISSFADIVEGIHVMQEQMGMAGTTMEEAASTISGSLTMVKAAWKNVVTGMADENADMDKLVGNLVDSLTVAAGQLFPAVENAVSGIGDLITELAPELAEILPEIISDSAPKLAQALSDTLGTALDSVTDGDIIINAALEILDILVETLENNAYKATDGASELLIALVNGISDRLPSLLPSAVTIVRELVKGITDNSGELISAALDLIISLGAGLIEALPELWQYQQEIPKSIAESLINYDWKTAASKTAAKVIEALDKALKKCQLFGDNWFNGGKLFGGDIANVDSMDFIKNARDGLGIIEETTEAYNKGSSAMADYYRKRGEEQEKYLRLAREEAEKADFWAAGSDAEEAASKIPDEFKQAYGELEALRVADIIDEEEYYRRLEELLTSYNAKGNALYNQYYSKLHTYRQKQEKAEQKTAEKIPEAFKKAYDELEELHAEGEIEDAEYYDRLEKLLEQHNAKGNVLYKQYYSKITSYRKRQHEQDIKDAQKAEKELTDALKAERKKQLSDVKTHLQKVAKEYQKQYNEIVKLKDDYKSKLKGGLDLFQKEETEDKIIYSIADIKKYKAQVQDFVKTIQALKDRGLDSSILNEIIGMGAEEGSIYGKELLKMSDSDFNNINDSFNQLSDMIDESANKLYDDDLKAVNEGFINEIKSSFSTLPPEIQAAGLDSAMAYIEGLDMGKSDVISEVQDFVSDTFDDIVKNTDVTAAGSNAAGSFFDSFEKVIAARSPSLKTSLLSALNFPDVAKKITAVVQAESLVLPAGAAKGAASSGSVSESKKESGKDVEKLIKEFNKPVNVMLEGQKIGQFFINFVNEKSAQSGGTVIA